MDPEQHPDAQFAEKLAEFDNALASRPSQATPLPDARQEDEGPRFERAAETLRLLESIWPRAPAAPEESASPPEEFGRFRLVREVGRGGFGVVFAAHDPVLGRAVALKIPRPEVVASPALVDRFLQEARAAANLNHPNIVQVHEAGFIGLTCYSVSELCDGPNLSQWLKATDQPMDPTAAVRLAALLADAVDHAHRIGILHRDVKPSNILLAKSPARGGRGADAPDALLGYTPKLTDFGLAKLLETSAEHTPAGTLIGTPEYMSPEQAEGRIDDIGPETDVYGLGAVLYECLAGRPPVQGETDLDTLRRVLADAPQDLRRIRRTIPPDLEAVCLRCLAKRPSDRYRSAADLADDLRRFLEGKPTLARPLSPPARWARWLRRRATAAAAAAVLAPLCLVAALGAWRLGRAAPDVAEDGKRIEKAHLRLEYVADMSFARQALDNADVDECMRRLRRHLPQPGREDLRGFEWRRLWRLANAEVATLDGFHDAVYHAAFFPDGGKLVACSADGTTALWRLDSRRPTWLEPPHLGEVNCVAVSPDGRWIASASDDATIQLRNADGALVRTLRGHDRGVATVAFHPDSKSLFSGGRDGVVRRWTLDEPRIERSWETDLRGVECVKPAPDGWRLFLVGDDAVEAVEDVEADDPPRALARTGGPLTAVDCTPDGERLVVVGQDRMVRVLDSRTGRVVQSWRAHGDWMNGVAVAPDGARCVTASRDNTAKVFDLATGRMEARLLGHRGRLWGVAVDPTGSTVATSGHDRCVKLWRLRHVDEAPTLAAYDEAPRTIAAAPDGTRLAVAFGDGRIELFDLDARRRTAEWRIEPELADLQFLPNSRLLAVHSRPGAVSIWRIESGAPVLERRVPAPEPTNAAVSADGRWSVVGARAGEWLLVDLSGESDAATAPTETAGTRVAVSPDGALAATYAYDATTSIWDAASRTRIGEVRGHRQHVNDVAFSPDGALLATASADASVALWSLPKGRPAAVLPGQGEEAVCVRFSPDGRTLLAGYKGGLFRLWNVAVQQEIYTRQTPLGEILRAEFTADQKYLAVLGKDPDSQRVRILVCQALGTGEEAAEVRLAATPAAP